MFKIIFLDIDGVLNSERYCRFVYERDGHCGSCDNVPFDPECLKSLRYIIDSTDAYIVVSSTWRLGHLKKVIEVLDSVGITNRIIGTTPNGMGMPRGEEILQYIKSAPFRISNVVILDDDADMGRIIHRLVKTDHRVGLTMEDAEKAIDLLRGEI